MYCENRRTSVSDITGGTLPGTLFFLETSGVIEK